MAGAGLDGVAIPLGRVVVAGLGLRRSSRLVAEAEYLVELAAVPGREAGLADGVRRDAIPEVRREGVPSMVAMGRRKVLVDARKEDTPSSGPELEPGRLRPRETDRINDDASAA